MINIKDLWKKGKDDFEKKQAEQERKLNRIINVTLDEMKKEELTLEQANKVVQKLQAAIGELAEAACRKTKI